MNPQNTVNKIEVAAGHLKEAIRMCLQQRNPIPTHSLAAAAYEILNDIGKKRKKYDTFKGISKSARNLWYNELMKTFNFCKHADKDSDGVLEYDPNEIPTTIFFCLKKYLDVVGEMFLEGYTFTAWFASMQTKKMSKEQMQNMSETVGIMRTMPLDPTFFLKNIDVIEELVQKTGKKDISFNPDDLPWV
jgi:hypothetical protein